MSILSYLTQLMLFMALVSEINEEEVNWIMNAVGLWWIPSLCFYMNNPGLNPEDNK